MTDIYDDSLAFHEKHRGKLTVQSCAPIETIRDLSLAYTPGVAEPCRRIAANPHDVYKYTLKSRTIAVVTDGSAVLGLGDIGPAASLPVMEGKCALFQQFGGVDAFPICIESDDVATFVETVKRIAIPFGGINLEDIKAPRCFEIEKRLRAELDIPVFHDDQHGTAIVLLAALINSLKVTGRSIGDARIVISGAGAAGIASAKLLLAYGARDIILCDRKGALVAGRDDLTSAPHKQEIAAITNPEKISGSLPDTLQGADVFVGVSGPGILTTEVVKTMAPNPIIIAMANPTPEIMPDDALAGGAAVVATGRSDFPNQVNNVLAFPGVFRGALDNGIREFTQKMYINAAETLAALVPNPTPKKIIPGIFDDGVMEAVSGAIHN